MRWPRPSAVSSLTTDAAPEEVKQTYKSNWESGEAAYRQAQANLPQARVNLERTRIVSPVNGYDEPSWRNSATTPTWRKPLFPWSMLIHSGSMSTSRRATFTQSRSVIPPVPS